MNFKGEIEIDSTTHYKDTHTIKKLEDTKKTPVWGYYFVDVYSRAYFVYYIACKGESIASWKQAFSQFFLDKKYHPVGGTFDVLYTDMGSALHSAELRGFLESINPEIQIKFHPKNSPEAKGIVEGRIGAHKRICEKFFQKGDFRTIEELNEAAMEFMIFNQTEASDKFKKYLEGLKLRPKVSKKVTTKNIQDAMVGRIKRQVNAYRCICYEGKEYLIPIDIPQGNEVDIFLRGEKLFAYIDGNLVELNESGRMTNEHPDAYRVSERIKRVKLIKENAKVYGENIHEQKTQTKIDTTELVEREYTEIVKTHSTLPPDVFETVEEAVQYIINETGLDEAEQVESFIATVSKLKEAFGVIPSEKIIELLGYLRRANNE